jgi:E3 ubiquitin-protein ligase BRE1
MDFFVHAWPHHRSERQGALERASVPHVAVYAALQTITQRHDQQCSQARLHRLLRQLAALDKDVQLLQDRYASMQPASADLHLRLNHCNANLDKSIKDFIEECERTSCLAKPLAREERSRGTELAQSSETNLPGFRARRVELMDMMQELDAVREVADQRLVELKQAEHEVSRLRVCLQEQQARPINEEVMKAHPLFFKIMQKGRQHLEQTRTDSALWGRSHLDTVDMNRMQHCELAHFRDSQLQGTDQSEQRHPTHLSQVRSERNALEQQAKLKSSKHHMLEERSKEMTKMLEWRRAEEHQQNRAVNRLATRLTEWEKDRDYAMLEKEKLRQATQALELQIEDIRLRPVVCANRAVQATEQHSQMELLRLGSAEQSALQAQLGVHSLCDETTALTGEMEVISQAVEASQELNMQSLTELQSKEEATAKLIAERLRAEYSWALTKTERDALQCQATNLAALQQRRAELYVSWEHNVKLAKEASGKKDDESHMATALIDRHTSDMRGAQLEAQEAAAQVKIATQAVALATERESKYAVEAAEHGVQVKRLVQERDVLQRKLARVYPCGKSDMASPAELQAQVDYYHRLIKCTLCKANDKNAIITKCCHTFCKDCIDQRLSLRNRKCPACSIQFDYQSARELYLTN